MREVGVLLVADARLALAVALGQVGDQLHLVGGGITRRAADRLQRDGDEGMTADAMRMDVLADPGVEAGIQLAGAIEDDAHRRARLDRLRQCEIALDPAALLPRQRKRGVAGGAPRPAAL